MFAHAEADLGQPRAGNASMQFDVVDRREILEAEAASEQHFQAVWDAHTSYGPDPAKQYWQEQWDAQVPEPTMRPQQPSQVHIMK